MSTPYPGIKINYNLEPTYPNTAQLNWIGAQSQPFQRGWWNSPPIIAGGGASIHKQLLVGRRMFCVGDFTSVGGVTRNNAFAYDVYTGVLDPWNPDLDSTGTAIAYDPIGGWLYLGGQFTHVNSPTVSISVVCRVDLNLGIVDPTWNPNPGTTIKVILVRNSNSIIVAGTFSGSVYIYEYRSNGSAGTLTFGGLNGTVLDLAYDAPNDMLYVGGAFTTSGVTTRNRALKWDCTNNVLTSWNPNFNQVVVTFALLPDGSLAVGGDFTGQGSTSVAYLCQLNASGVATSFNASINSTSVNSVAYYNNSLFFSGGFTTVLSTSRAGLAAVDLQNNLLPWDPVSAGYTSPGTMYVSERTIYSASNVIPYPLLVDDTTISVSKSGLDSNAGTVASPVLTLAHAMSLLGGSRVYVCVRDSGVYSEVLNWSVASSGLYAADGQTPTINPPLGAVVGTYGARILGRKQFYQGAHYCYVSKLGNNSTGMRDNPLLPFLTIAAAVMASSDGDCIQIQDSGIYTEDVSCGAKSLTFQSVSDQVPTLVNVSTSTQHFTASAGKKLSLYGLNVSQLKTGTAYVVSGDFNLDLYDCTFAGATQSNGFNITGSTGGTHIINAVNCSFGGMICFSGWTGALNCTNCYFNRCYTPIVQTANATQYTITTCTFYNSIVNAIINAANYTGGLTSNTVKCIFNGCVKLPYVANGGKDLSGYAINSAPFDNTSAAVPTDAIVVSGCYFTNLDRGGVAAWWTGYSVTGCYFYKNFVNTTTPPSIGATYTVPIATISSKTYYIQPGDITYFGANPGFASRPSPGMLVTNCISIGSLASGFVMWTPVGVTTFVNYFTVLNAAQYGVSIDDTYWVYGNAIPTASGTTIYATNIIGIAEYGSGTYGLFDSSTGVGPTAHRSVVNSPVLNFPLAVDSYQGSPQFASPVSGFEDVSLIATSPAILFGNSTNTIDAGATIPLLTVSADLVEVEGFTFDGLLNFYSGIFENSALPNGSNFRYNTFSGDLTFGINFQAIYKLSPGKVNHNLFLNEGAGVKIASYAKVDRNCFVSNSAGAIINLAFGATITNNSAYDCAYGQFDVGNVQAALQENNIYSDSSVYDYQGDNEQLYSCVGTLSPTATIDLNSTQLNPLYQDPQGDDLRIQALATGQFFDSPCIGKASDGGDMGAFKFFYTPQVLVFDLLDMGLVVGPRQNYRNPDKVERILDNIKLAEGIQEDGTTFSDVVAQKLHLIMTWDAAASDMPQDQTQQLVDVYQTRYGKIQIDIGDGNGFLYATVLRATQLSYEDLVSYSAEGQPQPVKTLEVRYD